MSKEQISPVKEHTLLVRGGAMNMIMNAEHGFKPNNGVLAHMKSINHENYNDKYDVKAYFQFLRQEFDLSGIEGLRKLLDVPNIPEIV